MIVSNSDSEVFQQAMEQQAKDTNECYMKTSIYGRHSIAGDIPESPEAVADLDMFLVTE